MTHRDDEVLLPIITSDDLVPFDPYLYDRPTPQQSLLKRVGKREERAAQNREFVGRYWMVTSVVLVLSLFMSYPALLEPTGWIFALLVLMASYAPYQWSRAAWDARRRSLAQKQLAASPTENSQHFLENQLYSIEIAYENSLDDLVGFFVFNGILLTIICMPLLVWWSLSSSLLGLILGGIILVPMSCYLCKRFGESFVGFDVTRYLQTRRDYVALVHVEKVYAQQTFEGGLSLDSSVSHGGYLSLSEKGGLEVVDQTTKKDPS